VSPPNQILNQTGAAYSVCSKDVPPQARFGMANQTVITVGIYRLPRPLKWTFERGIRRVGRRDGAHQRTGGKTLNVSRPKQVELAEERRNEHEP
jgi:hypothetical protein